MPFESTGISTSMCGSVDKRRATATSVKFRHLICLAAMLVAALSFAQAAGPELAAALLEISKSLNKNLPLRIDNEKVLDTTAVVGDTLIVKYRFTDETVISNPRFDPERYVSALRTSLGQSTCKGSFEVLKMGAKFNYLFVNSRGLKVIDFTLDAKTCNNFLKGK